MIHLDAGVTLEHLAHQVHHAARTGRAVEQRLLGLFGVFHEFSQVARGNRSWACPAAGISAVTPARTAAAMKSRRVPNGSHLPLLSLIAFLRRAASRSNAVASITLRPLTAWPSSHNRCSCP